MQALSVRSQHPPIGGQEQRQEGFTEMSIKKSLLLSVAAMAIAMTAFASSAMAATDGVIKDTNGSTIVEGTVLSAKGWAKFETLGTGIECHVEAAVKAGKEGKVGEVTVFKPVAATCHGFGSIYKNCKVTSTSVENLPYPATVTPTDIDVTDEITILGSLNSCENTKLTFTNLFFEEATLIPLKTGANGATNTENHLGGTASAGEEIAGIEIEAEGEAVNNIGTLAVEATGELEIEGAARCTYKIA